jgi:hypothetical protein
MCQTRLKLSWEVNECKPLLRGIRARDPLTARPPPPLPRQGLTTSQSVHVSPALALAQLGILTLYTGVDGRRPRVDRHGMATGWDVSRAQWGTRMPATAWGWRHAASHLQPNVHHVLPSSTGGGAGGAGVHR